MQIRNQRYKNSKESMNQLWQYHESCKYCHRNYLSDTVTGWPD